jgi:hypothetical protein
MEMSLWLLIVLFGLIKLPLAGVMLWIPFHNDEAMRATGETPSDAFGSEDDGGSRTLPGGPHAPHPHRPFPRPPRVPGGPRRDPHGAPSPPSPPRIRTGEARPRRLTNS